MNELATGRWQQYQVITLQRIGSFMHILDGQFAVINLIANCNIEV